MRCYSSTQPSLTLTIHRNANYFTKRCEAFMFHQNYFIVPVQNTQCTKCSCGTWSLSYMCVCLCVCAPALIRLLSVSHSFFLFFFPPSPSTPLVHSSLCVCMCLITHGPPLPSARHMVHSFASFDMRRLENVFVPVEFWHVFAAWQPEFRQSESRVVNKRHKISSNNKVASS